MTVPHTPDTPGRLAIFWLPHADADDRTLERLAISFTGVRNLRIRRACRSCGSDRHGKPQVVGAPIHVSLSRAGGRAVIAVTDAGPVGVDVELAASTTLEMPDVTTWVRKESVLKATGHALRLDPDLIEVTAPGTRSALVAWHSTEPPTVPVWMFDLECSHELVAVATVLSKVQPRLVSSALPED